MIKQNSAGLLPTQGKKWQNYGFLNIFKGNPEVDSANILKILSKPFQT